VKEKSKVRWGRGEGGQGVSHCSVMVGEGGWDRAGAEATEGGGGGGGGGPRFSR